jgi:hypothetical protein
MRSSLGLSYSSALSIGVNLCPSVVFLCTDRKMRFPQRPLVVKVLAFL